MQESQSDLQSLKREFALWRNRKRSKQGRTPERLWRETVHLCERYPLNVVRHELGLYLNRIKEKISKYKGKPEPTFISVELPTPKVTDSVCEWVGPGL
jgi:hypothetical protein